jgi:hypothetical protein
MKNLLLAFCTLSLAFGSAEVLASEPMGAKPTCILGMVSSVPNQQAISKTIWAPGLDDGFVPQGLTNAPGQVLIAGLSFFAAIRPERFRRNQAANAE